MLAEAHPSSPGPLNRRSAAGSGPPTWLAPRPGAGPGRPPRGPSCPTRPGRSTPPNTAHWSTSPKSAGFGSWTRRPGRSETDVFPPRLLDPGRPPRHPVRLAAGIPAMGPARAAEGQQRGPLRSRGDLPTDLVCWLAGLGVAVAANPPRCPQANGVVERGQGVGKQWCEPWTCGSGDELQRRLETMDRVHREVYPVRDSLPRLAAYPGLKHSGRTYEADAREIDLGPPEGLGSRGQALGVQPAIQRRIGVGRSKGVGRLRPRGGAMDVPGRSRARDSTPSGQGIEQGVGVRDGADPPPKGSPCGKPTARINAAKPTAR